MMKTTYRGIGLLFVSLFYIGIALAEGMPYSEEKYREAIQSGSPVVLDFYADWCPTCRSQAKVLNELTTGDEELAKIKIFKVDYDKAAKLKSEHKVTKQSTLILLKGEQELARVMGETDIDKLRAFLTKGLE